MRSWLLLLRFIIVNVVAVGIVVALWLQGWLDAAFEGYTGWLIGLIVLVFLYGFLICLFKVIGVSRDLTAVRAGMPATNSRPSRYLAEVRGHQSGERTIRANLLRLNITNDVVGVRHVANTLVFLGLVGTIIGFIIALSGVDPDSASSTEKVAPMISTLITGMSIALYTTLVGAILHVWLNINYRMLSAGALALFDATVDLGERRVGR